MPPAPLPRTLSSRRWGKALAEAADALEKLGQHDYAQSLREATTPRRGRDAAYAAERCAQIVFDAARNDDLIDRALTALDRAWRAWRACVAAEVMP